MEEKIKKFLQELYEETGTAIQQINVDWRNIGSLDTQYDMKVSNIRIYSSKKMDIL